MAGRLLVARAGAVRPEALTPADEEVRRALGAELVVREVDAREVDRRCAVVFPALADALFCVRAAAIGAQSVV